jgi:hypothetical protein
MNILTACGGAPSVYLHEKGRLHGRSYQHQDDHLCSSEKMMQRDEPLNYEPIRQLPLFHTGYLSTYALFLSCSSHLHNPLNFLNLTTYLVQHYLGLFTMFFSRPHAMSYTSVESFDSDQEELKNGAHSTFALERTDTTVKIGVYPTLILAILFCISTVSTWALFFQRSALFHQLTPQVQIQWQCVKPAIRQEWRSLTTADKSRYIAAVQCLESKPSRVRNNGTLYDDFPWVHKSTSTDSMSMQTY